MRLLLPRTAPPPRADASLLNAIQGRIATYFSTRDANVLATVTPLLARDVRSLVDHHDALAYGREEEPCPQGFPLPTDDKLDAIVSRLTRFEQSRVMSERAALQPALAKDAHPLFIRVQAIKPYDPDDTVPPFGRTLHIAPAESWGGPVDRCFDVWIGFACLYVQFDRASSSGNEPWTVSVGQGKARVMRTAADAIEALCAATEEFLKGPDGWRERAAGFTTDAVETAFGARFAWLF